MEEILDRHVGYIDEMICKHGILELDIKEISNIYGHSFIETISGTNHRQKTSILMNTTNCEISYALHERINEYVRKSILSRPRNIDIVTSITNDPQRDDDDISTLLNETTAPKCVKNIIAKIVSDEEGVHPNYNERYFVYAILINLGFTKEYLSTLITSHMQTETDRSKLKSQLNTISALTIETDTRKIPGCSYAMKNNLCPYTNGKNSCEDIEEIMNFKRECASVSLDHRGFLGKSHSPINVIMHNISMKPKRQSK